MRQAEGGHLKFFQRFHDCRHSLGHFNFSGGYQPLNDFTLVDARSNIHLRYVCIRGCVVFIRGCVVFCLLEGVLCYVYYRVLSYVMGCIHKICWCVVGVLFLYCVCIDRMCILTGYISTWSPYHATD